MTARGDATAGEDAVRRILRLSGAVQGVGFRPFVYRRAVIVLVSMGVPVSLDVPGSVSVPVAAARGAHQITSTSRILSGRAGS